MRINICDICDTRLDGLLYVEQHIPESKLVKPIKIALSNSMGETA